MRSRVCPPSGIASLMVVLGSVALASGQTAPSFRSGAQLQLIDATTAGAEAVPSAVIQRELFGGLPEFRTDEERLPKLPRAVARLPGAVQPIPIPEVSIRMRETGLPAAAKGTTVRTAETPIAFQRHPDRNLAAQDGDNGFTFRSTSDAGVLAQIRAGIQADTWHSDNVANTKRSLAIEDVIMELRPIIQLNLGSLPAGRAADSLRSEYYLELRYTPTLHTLLDAGTARVLQRVAGEIGRASPVLMSAVRFEYDENIFGARGTGSVEESSTVTEVSPVIEYGLSAKTTLHAEATWRRIVTQTATTNRSEYILETGIATASTPKTTLGTGLEFGHIPFDEAQFGAQNYQQAYASMAWQASSKIRFQTRAGVELRQFDKPVPKPARVTPVASVILNWSPNESARINTGFLVRNQPSVSKLGATFREIRFGTDGRFQVGRNFYVRGEAAVIQRSYDTGTRELEVDVRPAFGFQTNRSRIFNSLNFEIYYQFQRVDSNQSGADRDRNIFGIESTLYF